MRISHIEEIINIECNGKRITAAVEAVESDPESPLFRQVTLRVLEATAPPQKGDQCYWLIDGEKIAAYLQGEVYEQNEIVKFRLRAIADSNHSQG